MVEKHKELFPVFIFLVMVAILIGGCSHLNRAFPARSAFEKANVLFENGNYQAALQRYERIAKDYPFSTDRVLFEMGIIHAHPNNQQENYQEAIECFQKIISQYPESPYRQDSETMIFAINNTSLKDQMIATQQAKINELQRVLKVNEKEIRSLRRQIESIERKHFAFVLEKLRADKVLIEKEERRMTLFVKGEVLKKYNIALGGDPIGPKERQGDNKTPEGIYTIASRNRDSSYHLALRLSYPNERDKRRAKELGVEPGGDIMIHGLKEGFSEVGDAHAGFDWTKGCIAVTDKEIEEIEKLVPNGTVVEIMP